MLDNAEILEIAPHVKAMATFLFFSWWVVEESSCLCLVIIITGTSQQSGILH